jgi:plasmid replication initiation protein
LIATRARWETGPDGNRLKGIANLLSAAITNKEAKKTGFLRFEIPSLLCEVIRAPCRFSRLRLHFMIGLSGKYAVTLYMLLESVSNRQTPVLDVELNQLRQWLKVPEGKLNEWFDLKRFAISPALKQINDNPEAAGFSVVMDEFKEGRAVDRVRFTLTKTAGRLADEKALKPKALDKPKTADNSGAFVLPTSAYEQAKKAAPGLDIYYLETEWRGWIAKKPQAGNLAGAFVEFCRKKYEKNNQ